MRRARFLRERAWSAVASDMGPEWRETVITEKLRNPSVGLALLERLFEQPVVTVHHVAGTLRRTSPIANQVVADLERLGLLREITGGSRNRAFAYAPYIEIFGELRP